MGAGIPTRVKAGASKWEARRGQSGKAVNGQGGQAGGGGAAACHEAHELALQALRHVHLAICALRGRHALHGGGVLRGVIPPALALRAALAAQHRRGAVSASRYGRDRDVRLPYSVVRRKKVPRCSVPAWQSFRSSAAMSRKRQVGGIVAALVKCADDSVGKVGKAVGDSLFAVGRHEPDEVLTQCHAALTGAPKVSPAPPRPRSATSRRARIASPCSPLCSACWSSACRTSPVRVRVGAVGVTRAEALGLALCEAALREMTEDKEGALAAPPPRPALLTR